MNNIDGLIYLLNQSGVALAEANARIAHLERENATLCSNLQQQSGEQV